MQLGSSFSILSISYLRYSGNERGHFAVLGWAPPRSLSYTIPQYSKLHHTIRIYTTVSYTIPHYPTLLHSLLHYATLSYTTPHYPTLLYTLLHYATRNFRDAHPIDFLFVFEGEKSIAHQWMVGFPPLYVLL